MFAHMCACTQGFKDFGEQIWLKRLFSEQLELEFIRYSLWAGHSLYYLILSSPKSSHLRCLLWSPPFTDGKSGAPSDYIICSCSYSCSVTEPDFKPQSGWLQSQTHISMAEPVGYQLLRVLTLKRCRTASGPSVSYLVWGMWWQEVGSQDPGSIEMGFYAWHRSSAVISSCEPVMVNFMC